MMLMGTGLMLTDRQHRVEQQYALLRPRFQAAIIRNGTTKIRLQFLKDIEQGRWRLYARQYRKGKEGKTANEGQTRDI